MDRDSACHPSSSKLLGGGTSFNLQEARIIEEEHSEYDPYDSPAQRLEENKYSPKADSNRSDDDDFFNISLERSVSPEPTPRFDASSKEITILSIDNTEVSSIKVSSVWLCI